MIPNQKLCFVLGAFMILLSLVNAKNYIENVNQNYARNLIQSSPRHYSERSLNNDNSKTYEIIGDQLFQDKNQVVQGLTYSNNVLYKSIGYIGKSEVCRLDPTTGQSLECVELNPDPKDHVLGIQVYGRQKEEKLIVLTLKYHSGYILDAKSLEVISTFEFNKSQFNEIDSESQNWGICWDHTRNEFIVSNGSAYLFFWDSKTLKEKRRVRVTRQDGSLATKLNEIEFVNGTVISTVWLSDELLVIDPVTGDCKNEYNLYPIEERLEDDAGDLNVVSVSDTEGVLFVTGIEWDRIYKIKLKEKVIEPETSKPTSSPKSDNSDGLKHTKRTKFTTEDPVPQLVGVIIISLAAVMAFAASLFCLVSRKNRSQQPQHQNDSFSSTLFGFSFNDRVYNRTLDQFLSQQEENTQRLANNMATPNYSETEPETNNYKCKLSMEEQKNYLSNEILEVIKLTSDQCQNTTENRMNCSICLDEFDPEETLMKSPNCEHIFHGACFLVWLERSDNCPFCRQAVVTNEEWKRAYDSILSANSRDK